MDNMDEKQRNQVLLCALLFQSPNDPDMAADKKGWKKLGGFYER